MDGYTIEEVAARTALSKHTLRYYEREGLLPPIGKAPSGHRRYTEDDIGWIRFLQLLRATGMPIREVKEFVTLTWAGDHTIRQRVAVLTSYRAALVERMARDADHLEALNRKIGYYEDVLAAQDATPEDITAPRVIAERAHRD
ncbi:MerR family transcriptional regulator [Microbacterium album]|uniref:MerR family transcriptional regulator n=1 Tax=Microbacterium album TaxID=2053191 RepID=A0A917IG01_9MICO|nr:MerR family transcriptional regulator [Microbacterium album]GGH45901.1 MerR family transcriptional regulator [Microbacterium album]